MRRGTRAVAGIVALAALVGSAVACSGDAGTTAARATGTTGTSRPRPAVATPVGEDPLPPALEERLQRTLDATRPTLAGTPGLIAAVWVPDVGAWASISVEPDPAETEPLATNDHVRIGTITTSLTVMLLLQLVDQGKLGLDDPVATWFPDATAAAGTTVRQLAGSRADADVILLGQIVEKVTGKPLRVALQDQLLGPLGMHQTALPESGDAAIPRPFARGVTLDPAVPSTTPPATLDATGRNPSARSFAAAATSTVLDLEIWGYHLGSGALVAPATFDAQRSFVATPGSTAPPYGLGLMSFPPPQLPALPWVGFEGGIDGYTTLVAFDPATRAVVVVIATSDVPVPDPAAPGRTRTPTMVTFDALRGALRSDPPPPPAGTVPGSTAPPPAG